MKPKRRQQLNIEVDEAILAAIDEIRALRRPVPSAAAAVREAIRNEVVRLRKARREARDER